MLHNGNFDRPCLTQRTASGTESVLQNSRCLVARCYGCHTTRLHHAVLSQVSETKGSAAVLWNCRVQIRGWIACIDGVQVASTPLVRMYVNIWPHGCRGLVCWSRANRLIGDVRCALLMTARSRQLGQATGIVITASHNPVEDSGVKLVDPSGEMLSQDWEVGQRT